MGKKKQTTTTNETSKIVQTPTNPAWVDSTLEGVTKGVAGLSSLDPNSLVAGLSDREKAAFERADGLGVDDSWFQQALGASAPTVTAASLLDGLDKYMSPYTKDVVDAALADFDFGAGQTRAAQDLELAGAGAFGGSGSAITRSMTEDALTRGRASTSATLRDEAFKTGANLSSQDAARRQSASEANAQLALTDRAQKAGLMLDRDANERANIASLAGAGSIEREVEQAKRLAPITALQAQTGLLSSLPLNLVHGQTQEGTKNSTQTSTQSGGMLEQLGTLAMAAGAAGLAPFTGGASLAGLLGGLGTGGLGALSSAAAGLAARSAAGGLAGDMFFGKG